MNINYLKKNHDDLDVVVKRSVYEKQRIDSFDWKEWIEIRKNYSERSALIYHCDFPLQEGVSFVDGFWIKGKEVVKTFAPYLQTRCQIRIFYKNNFDPLRGGQLIGFRDTHKLHLNGHFSTEIDMVMFKMLFQ